MSGLFGDFRRRSSINARARATCFFRQIDRHAPAQCVERTRVQLERAIELATCRGAVGFRRGRQAHLRVEDRDVRVLREQIVQQVLRAGGVALR